MKLPLPLIASLLFVACTSIQKEADTFIQEYEKEYSSLSTAASEAEWKANTYISKDDTLTAWNSKKANKKFAEFSGKTEYIEKCKYFLQKQDELSPLQLKQIKAILYIAASNPETAADLVKKKIDLESEMVEKLYSYQYTVVDSNITTNQIDRILNESTNLNERLKFWESSKKGAISLKEDLANIRSLRNLIVQKLDYSDYFSFQVSDYGMTTQEMMDMNKQLLKDSWPLYRELHTWMRYELAKKYHTEVPDYLPAHWLPNRWGQDWSSGIKVEGIDLDGALAKKGPEWLVKQAERFYVSLGFDSLPKSFYEKSDLYPLPKDVVYSKNNHASAWHLDRNQDVRCLMSVEANSNWYETTHHELGHIYYYLCYSTPEVPILLRNGANRAFHEAIGSMIGMASMQEPFLSHIGLIDTNTKSDKIQPLLKEAMNYIVFMPFASGLMTNFEKELYADNLPIDQFNQRWWALKKKYQGIVPPTNRGEEYCDPASKTHIVDDPAQYYDYALSYAILFQLHNHIAKNILKQEAGATNYFGNKEVGDFLKNILSKGATVDWRALLKEATGEELSAKGMIAYFSPLMDWLKKENEGRKYTLAKEL